MSNNIRNFSIIAHIDHGKSTLADRLLEKTHTVEARKMKDQVLDSMELERERGITIKMQPVRMVYHPSAESYILNLIDTPGHIDFYYEVSRALKAVEGALLLVDSTQGVQAQTLTTLAMARDIGLTIIPVVTKIDSPLARIPETKKEISKVLGVAESTVLECSGRTGEGVDHLLTEIVRQIPPPRSEFKETKSLRALVFDFQYSNHRGVIVYVRVTDGSVKKGDELLFSVAGKRFIALEVGTFSPDETPRESLGAGEIGYIVTGVKEPGIASVGDTITLFKNPLPILAGYQKPKPVVWASLYPENQDDFAPLRLALSRLQLSDSSFSYEEESSGTLGRGFRVGFLGMLHLEIITERLRREFQLELIVTTPSITYEVELKNGKKKMVYSPVFFPDDHEVVRVVEPWVKINVITPSQYLGAIMNMLYTHEAEAGDLETFGESSPPEELPNFEVLGSGQPDHQNLATPRAGSDSRNSISAMMPLRELMRGFFDEIKSVSSGFSSVSYEFADNRPADVTRLDILVADEVVPAFSRVVSRRRAEEEAEKAVKKLHENLPRQMFTTKIQAKAFGRIIASETLSALRKDVTGYLYGGDITRKMKLLEKQKRGKKKMKERGTVNIPHDVFIKMMRSES